MRLELALIVGILFFCCWCAYIIVKMNSSVSSASELELNNQTSGLSSTNHNHNLLQHQQHYPNTYSTQDYQQVVPYQNYYASSPSQANRLSTNPQSNNNYRLQTTPLKTEQWQQPSSSDQYRQMGRPQLPLLSETTNYEAAPSDNFANLQPQLVTAHNGESNPDSESANADEAVTETPEIASDLSEGQLAEEEPTSDDDEEAATEEPSDGNEEQTNNEEALDDGLEPINSELVERAGRRTFSEDETDANERDENGVKVKEHHRHLLNGKPVRDRREKDQSMKAAEFKKIVNEIEGNDDEGEENNQDSGGVDEKVTEAPDENQSGVALNPTNDIIERRGDQQNFETVNSSNNNNKSATPPMMTANKTPQKALVRDKLDKEGAKIGALIPGKWKRPKDSHQHQMYETLSAKQWDNEEEDSTPPTTTNINGNDDDGNSDKRSRLQKELPIDDNDDDNYNTSIKFEDLDLLTNDDEKKVPTSDLNLAGRRYRRQVHVLANDQEDDDDSKRNGNGDGNKNKNENEEYDQADDSLDKSISRGDTIMINLANSTGPFNSSSLFDQALGPRVNKTSSPNNSTTFELRPYRRTGNTANNLEIFVKPAPVSRQPHDPVSSAEDLNIGVLANPPNNGVDFYTTISSGNPAPILNGHTAAGLVNGGGAGSGASQHSASGAPLTKAQGFQVSAKTKQAHTSLGPYAKKGPLASGSKMKKRKEMVKKKKKKVMKKSRSKMYEAKVAAAKAHSMKKKESMRAKKAKAKKHSIHNYKAFKGSTKGKKAAKGKANRGTKKGSLYYKDRGYKKRGFKKAYQKVEAGDHKTYFDEFRDKDHNKRWKQFKDGHHYSQHKNWAGKDKKLLNDYKSGLMRHKNSKSGAWKDRKSDKYRKDYKSKKGKKSSSSTKKHKSNY